MLAAIGRRVQRVFQKSSSPLLNRGSTLFNNGDNSSNIWKYKANRRSFSTSLFQKDTSEKTLKLREVLRELIRRYPKTIDFKTANNGIERFLKSANNIEEEVECYNAKALVCLQSADLQGALDMSNKSIALLQSPDSYALRAYALSFLGQTKEALKDFKTVFDRFPAQWTSQIWSKFEYLAKDTKEYQTGALNVMKRAIQIFPNDASVIQAFDAVAWYVSMSEQEQLECYLKAADVNPNNVLVWRYAIKLDLDNAHQYVTQALLHNPSSHEMVWSTLTEEYTYKDVTRAVEAAKTLLSVETIQDRQETFYTIFCLVRKIIFNKELALINDCQELLKRILTFDPSNSTAMNELGRTYFVRQQFDQAKECCVRALEMDSNNVWAIIYLADLTTDLQERAKLYERVVELAPRLFEMHYSLAQSYYKRGQYEQALETIDRVIRGSPNVTPEHYFRKAMIHGQLKQYDKELQAYLQHFKMQMNDPVQSGQVYFLEHRFEEGLAHNDIHLQKDPHNAILWLQRAVLLKQLGRYSEALEVIEKLLDGAPANYRGLVLHQKGLILAHLKRTREARQIAQLVIDECKLKTNELVILGEICIQEGNFEEAVKCFEKLLEDNPEFHPHRYEKYLLLARALDAKGDVTRAREMFALVHHINPFEPISVERLKQLDGNK